MKQEKTDPRDVFREFKKQIMLVFEAYSKTIEHAATPSGAEIQIMAFARTLIDKLMTSFPDLKNLIMDKGQGNDSLSQGVSSMLMGGGGGRPN